MVKGMWSWWILFRRSYYYSFSQWGTFPIALMSFIPIAKISSRWLKSAVFFVPTITDRQNVRLAQNLRVSKSSVSPLIEWMKIPKWSPFPRIVLPTHRFWETSEPKSVRTVLYYQFYFNSRVESTFRDQNQVFYALSMSEVESYYFTLILFY